jgi:hypothetical protein
MRLCKRSVVAVAGLLLAIVAATAAVRAYRREVLDAADEDRAWVDLDELLADLPHVHVIVRSADVRDDEDAAGAA